MRKHAEKLHDSYFRKPHCPAGPVFIGRAAASLLIKAALESAETTSILRSGTVWKRDAPGPKNERGKASRLNNSPFDTSEDPRKAQALNSEHFRTAKGLKINRDSGPDNTCQIFSILAAAGWHQFLKAASFEESLLA